MRTDVDLAKRLIASGFYVPRSFDTQEIEEIGERHGIRRRIVEVVP